MRIFVFGTGADELVEECSRGNTVQKHEMTRAKWLIRLGGILAAACFEGVRLWKKHLLWRVRKGKKIYQSGLDGGEGKVSSGFVRMGAFPFHPSESARGMGCP